MKLSDKLLIFVILAALAIIGSAHLSLYSKYKKGAFVVSGGHINKSFSTPAHLAVTGFSNVTLIHSDSFFIEYENPEQDPGDHVRHKEGEYRETPIKRPITPSYKGDTMMIYGFDSLYPASTNHLLTLAPSGWIYIHCPNISSISQEGGMLSLNGDTSAAHAFSASLWLENVQLAQVLGSGVEFNELSIACINSRIDMGRAHVQQLQLRLDKPSSAVLTTRIDHLSLQYDDESNIELSGAALRGMSQPANLK